MLLLTNPVHSDQTGWGTIVGGGSSPLGSYVLTSAVGQQSSGITVWGNFSLNSGFLQNFTIPTIPVYSLEPPGKLTATDVPGDQGHQLQLTWILSPDDGKGVLQWYRIYRSRNSVFESSLPVDFFSSPEELNNWEAKYAVLIDSVTVGVDHYVDRFVPLNGVAYYYWVQAVGFAAASGKVSTLNPVVVEDERNPSPFIFKYCYPNPFNPSTTMVYSLHHDSRTILKVYNISGALIEVLVDDFQRGGEYSVLWDAKDMPSGIYVFRLQVGSQSVTRKALLLK
ncbi:MAG: T9SS type A sorting domain-containing protein [Candidatus Latescibacterota bacterium]